MDKRAMAWLREFLTSDGFIDFAVWLAFSFVISLSPFWVSWLGLGVFGFHYDFWNMLEAGELLLICCGLAGAGMGDIFKHWRALVGMKSLSRRSWHDIATLYCTSIFMLVVAISILLYGSMKAAERLNHYKGKEFVIYPSIVMFAATVITAALCASLTRGSPRKGK